MAISAKDVQDLRKRTGAGIMDCKKALVESDGDQEKAIKLLKEWGIAKAAKKSGREASEGVLVAVISDDSKTGALIEVNCETDFVANTDEYRAFAKSTAELIFSKGYNNTDDLGDDAQTKVKEGISQFKENIIIGSIKRIETSGKLSSYIHTNFKNGTIVSVEGDGTDNDKVNEMGKDIAVHISSFPVSAVSKDDVDQAILDEKTAEFTEEIKKQGKPDNIIPKIVQGKINKFLKEETLYSQSFLKNEDITVKQLVDNVSKEIGGALQVKGFIKTVIGA